jgi:hypothetical protein
MTRPIVAVLTLWIASPSPSAAGDLFGGYSLMRLEDSQVNGGAVAASWSLSQTTRLTVEGSLERGLVGGQHFEEWAVLGGAALAPWGVRRLSPFVHAKAGFVRSRRQIEVFGVAIGPEGPCDGGCAYSTGAAAEFGGGLDYRLSDRLSLRVPQVDYRVTALDEATANRFRVSAGVVYRWND